MTRRAWSRSGEWSCVPPEWASASDGRVTGRVTRPSSFRQGGLRERCVPGTGRLGCDVGCPLGVSRGEGGRVVDVGRGLWVSRAGWTSPRRGWVAGSVDARRDRLWPCHSTAARSWHAVRTAPAAGWWSTRAAMCPGQECVAAGTWTWTATSRTLSRSRWPSGERDAYGRSRLASPRTAHASRS